MRDEVRKLTEQEFALLKPELEAYIQGQSAQERLVRMLGLFAPGCDLDLKTLTLTREIPDDAAPALKLEPAEEEVAVAGV